MKHSVNAVMSELVGGNEKVDRDFFRVTFRDGDKLTLQPMSRIIRNGRAWPGVENLDKKPFVKRLKIIDGVERGCADNRNGYAGFMRLFSPDKFSHGGKRSGAGRPIGTGSGKKVIACSVTLSPEEWALIDQKKGKLSRGAFLSLLLHKEKK